MILSRVRRREKEEEARGWRSVKWDRARRRGKIRLANIPMRANGYLSSLCIACSKKLMAMLPQRRLRLSNPRRHRPVELGHASR